MEARTMLPPARRVEQDKESKAASLWARACAAVLTLGLVTTGATAQDKPAAQPSSAKAQEVMARALKTYSGLRSYHETSLSKAMFETSQGADPPDTTTIELTAAPGRRLHLTSEELELVSNGKT